MVLVKAPSADNVRASNPDYIPGLAHMPYYHLRLEYREKNRVALSAEFPFADNVLNWMRTVKVPPKSNSRCYTQSKYLMQNRRESINDVKVR